MGIGSLIGKFKKYWNWKRIIKNIKFIIKNDFEDFRYQLKDEIIEDCFYELPEMGNYIRKLNVLNETETIGLLGENEKSFCRFGDGEIDIMMGKDGVFQKYDPELARKLKEVLVRKKENLYVGLNSSYFHTPIQYSERNRRFYRLKGTLYRRFFVDICDLSNTYLDACCFGGYFRQGDSFDIDAHFMKVRNLFKDKKLAIVCGDGILDDITYDLFELAKEKKVISAPKRDAFAEYDSIVKNIVDNVPKDHLVCLILGMTATVLAADLADLGYTAWDIGHASKEYDAFRKKVEKTDGVIDKFFGAE